MERRLSGLEAAEKKRLGKPVSPKHAEGVRFSARWLLAHRQKLGLSQADYAKLVGVSKLTIYNWESERTKPRKDQLAAWAAVRKLKKREALRRLELLD